MPCGNCGFDNPEGFAFCGRCGARLEAPALKARGLSPAELDHLHSYLPADLLEELRFDAQSPSARLLEQCQTHLGQLLALSASHLPHYLVDHLARDPRPGHIGGQFLNGTLAFADISGFTAMSESLSRGGREGAEEITAIVNRYFSVMLNLIREHDGQLIKFGGDALLALFLEPESAARATHAAWRMQHAMAGFAETKTSRGTFPLRMKVGLKRGRFFAAELGTAQDMEYALLGADVNATAVTEGAAVAGQVLLDEATRQALTVPARVSPGPTGYFVVEGLEDEWRGASAATSESALPRLSEPKLDNLRRGVNLLDALTPYLPPGLLTRLSSGRRFRLEGEHRLVAVTFANVVGLGDLVEALGPGREIEITTALNRYFTAMSAAVLQFGGVVNKLDLSEHGDKLLAFFGAPVAHEDDVERATRAAWEMQRGALAEVNRAWPGRAPLRQKLGVSYGFVFAGYMGTEWRREYTVMGDEVNLAARLMSAARADSLTVSGSVLRRSRAFFSFTSRGSVTLKGKSQPYDLYTLDERVSMPVEEVREIPPVVGRDLEWNRLTTSAEKFLAGRGQLITLVGEAGLGKTRLTTDLHAWLDDHATERGLNLRWVVGRCLSYTEATSYQPFQIIARRLLSAPTGQGDTVTAAQVIEMVESRLPPAEVVNVLPYLLNFLDLPLSEAHRERVRHLDTETLQRRTFIALGRWLEVSAADDQARLALVLGDIHWMDAGSLALLNYLLPLAERLPILLVLTYRPEHTKGCWAIHERMAREFAHRTTAVTLEPLAPEYSRALLDHLIPPAQRPADFDALVLNRTEGNPFYLEEMVQMLMEKGVLTQRADGRWEAGRDLATTPLPDTLQGVLISRLDALDEAARHTTAIASVIGRTFSFDLLAEVEPENRPALRATLARLQQAQLITEVAEAAELTYIFRNALTQEVCYETLLVSTRSVYHRRLAEILDARHAAGPGEADVLTPLIAYHAFLGRHWERALPYQWQAGQKAQQLFANVAALEHYTKALHSAEELPPDETLPLRLAVHLALGELHTTTGQYDPAQDHLAQARALALEHHDPEREARACRWLARLHELRGEYPPAFEWIEKGLKALAGSDTPTAEAAQLRLIAGLIYKRQGQNDPALQSARAAQALAEEVGELAVLARADNLLGLLRLRHDPTEAVTYFQTAFRLYEQAGHLGGQATSHNMLGNAGFDAGQWSQADGHYRAARAAFEQMGDVYNTVLANNNLGEIALYQGRLDEALEFYHSARRALDEIGGSLWVRGGLESNLGATHLRRHDPTAALPHLHAALGYFDQAQARDWLPELYRHFATAAFQQSDYTEAEVKGQLALSLAREQDNRAEVGNSLRALGQLAAAQGRAQEAETGLQESCRVFEEIGNEYELARSRLALAEVYAAQSRGPEGLALAEQAVTVFERLEAALDLAAARELQDRFSPLSPDRKRSG